MSNQEWQEKNKWKTRMKRISSSVGAGVIGSALTIGVLTQIDFPTKQEAIPAATEQLQNTTESNVQVQQMAAKTTSVADIVENSSPAIVGVVNKAQVANPFNRTTEEAETGTGSGVIYEVKDNEAFIVTNNHVIENAETIEVSLANGDVVQAKLVGADPLTDMAVLKIEGKYDITPLAFGDSDTLRAGDQVLAIGNPLGLDLSRTATKGIISAVDRSISVNTSSGEWELNVIQTDAAINPGNSGGALINEAGEVIGINSLKISDDGVEGLGFAIPSNDVLTIIDQLTKDGQVVRPYLGVSLANVSQLPSYYVQSLPKNAKEGAIVMSVDQESPAGKAGIQEGDVIISINDEAITSQSELRKFLYTELSVGDKVTMKVYREGKEETVSLTLTSNQQQSSNEQGGNHGENK